MNATKISENDHANEGLALVGDTILKFVLADKIFTEETKIKGEITKSKEKLENNHNLFNVSSNSKIQFYLYNKYNEKALFYGEPNASQNELVHLDEGHDASIEAIIAAIYYDSSFDDVKNWILYFLYPLLKKYSTI